MHRATYLSIPSFRMFTNKHLASPPPPSRKETRIFTDGDARSCVDAESTPESDNITTPRVPRATLRCVGEREGIFAALLLSTRAKRLLVAALIRRGTATATRANSNDLSFRVKHARARARGKHILRWAATE